MSQPNASATNLTAADTEGGAGLGATLLRVAWLAIILGLVIEAILLLVAAGLTGIPGIQKIVADLVQKISWSVLVCVGLAFGRAASKGQPAWTGLSGLFAAPVAFNVAGTMHKSAAYALNLPAAAGSALPFLIAGLKGLEYGALGWLLASIGKRAGVGVSTYAGVGFGIGLVFATAIVYSSGANLAKPAGISQFINELLFPIGCSLALFAADVLGKRVVK